MALAAFLKLPNSTLSSHFSSAQINGAMCEIKPFFPFAGNTLETTQRPPCGSPHFNLETRNLNAVNAS